MMISKDMDFQGIVTLDKNVVAQLKTFLEEKESSFSHAIIQALHELPLEQPKKLTISDAVEIFGQRVRSPAAPIHDWEEVTTQINNALWEYAELLEGYVTELFQQLRQMGFEEWNDDLQEVIESLKRMLDKRLEELYWKVQRLESLLWDYRLASTYSKRKKWADRFFYFWKSMLDRSLLRYIKKTRQYLNERYVWFVSRHTEYLKLTDKIALAVKKFDHYPAFQTLDDGMQQEYKKLYQLLKLWKSNQKAQAIPEREAVRSIRSAFNVERVGVLVEEYLKTLEAMLFSMSRSMKEEPNTLYRDENYINKMHQCIYEHHAELHTLAALISNYRNFFLGTHPNPYIRTKWGFSEWIVGQEPKQTKDLLSLLYDVERLDRAYTHLEESFNKGPDAYSPAQLSEQKKEMLQAIHEMGQPLTSRSVVRAKADGLVVLMEQVDELGSFNPDSIEVIEQVLSKALQADWRFHVLFDISSFETLYATHQQLKGGSIERGHQIRLIKFNEVFNQLNLWVKNRETHRHIYEIEHDIQDLKQILQEFLGNVQSAQKQNKKEEINKLQEQLLEYRFHFAKFFHQLSKEINEGRYIRQQFLFIDQYLEAIELALGPLM